jgi:hypothetical protein
LRTSYTGRRPERQSLTCLRAAVLAVLALAVTGCAGVGGTPFGAGSGVSGGRGVIQAAVTDAVDPSDWEAVRRTLAKIGTDALDLAWQNPKTGSSGTVTAMAAEPRSGGVCRVFATTVNDLRGIRRYRGEACQPQGENWRLTGIIPEDSTLL